MTRDVAQIEELPSTPDNDSMYTIRVLQKCALLCQKVLTANMPKENGRNIAYLHLRRLQACSEICESTARLLLKDGICVEYLCEIAARICEQCASSCDKIATPSFLRVADICRQAAEVCLSESYRIKREAV